jgi:hypothetical protein
MLRIGHAPSTAEEDTLSAALSVLPIHPFLSTRQWTQGSLSANASFNGMQSEWGQP